MVFGAGVTGGHRYPLSIIGILLREIIPDARAFFTLSQVDTSYSLNNSSLEHLVWENNVLLEIWCEAQIVKPVDFMNLITSTGAFAFFFELKISSKWPNFMCLPVSLPSKMPMSLLFILSPKKNCQVQGLIGHRAILCWSKIFQNSDRSPIDGGFELFEYAKLPTGFYQSREMTGKAPSCRDNSASFFSKGSH